MKVYAVGIDGLSKSQEYEFRELLIELELQWWYWIKGFWLVADGDESSLSAVRIRDILRDITHPEQLIIVIKIDSVELDWSGLGPPEMATWFSEALENRVVSSESS